MFAKILLWILCSIGAVEVLYFAREAFDDYISRKISEAVNDVVKTMKEN